MYELTNNKKYKLTNDKMYKLTNDKMYIQPRKRQCLRSHKLNKKLTKNNIV